MLVTMLTAMYIMVRTAESIGACFARKPEPMPYMVHQPLPWQIHSVSRRRRSSRMDEFDPYRKNSIGIYRKNTASMAIASASLAIPCFLSCSDSANGTIGELDTVSVSATAVASALPPLSPVEVEKAAATIQSHFRKFQQQKKQKDDK